MTAVALLTTACSGTPPVNIGVSDNKLAPCPDKPNCVVSHRYDEPHYIEPLSYNIDQHSARALLIDVIEGLPRTEIIEREGNYLRVEFTSRIMRFVDDVEFYFDPAESVIQLRSASRLGHSDMGVNRQRMEHVRQLLVPRLTGKN